LFFNCLGNCLSAVLRFSNDLPTGARLQKSTQSRSHRYMIVSDKKPPHDQTKLQCRIASSVDMFFPPRFQTSLNVIRLSLG
jgi:hypothetical protein